MDAGVAHRTPVHELDPAGPRGRSHRQQRIARGAGCVAAVHLTVVPSTSTAAEPAADLTMRLTDYTFTLPNSLVAAMQTIRLENGAQQPREVFLVQFAPDKTTEGAHADARRPLEIDG